MVNKNTQQSHGYEQQDVTADDADLRGQNLRSTSGKVAEAVCSLLELIFPGKRGDGYGEFPADVAISSDEICRRFGLKDRNNLHTYLDKQNVPYTKLPNHRIYDFKDIQQHCRKSPS